MHEHFLTFSLYMCAYNSSMNTFLLYIVCTLSLYELRVREAAEVKEC